MSNYITPPNSLDCKWRKGPPPDIGWWPASSTCDPQVLRYWDGKHWSWYARPTATANFAGRIAQQRALPSRIQWTDRWWEKQP